MQKAILIVKLYWRELLFAVSALAGMIYVLVILFVTNKLDWLPVVGQLWVFNAEVRKRQAHLRSLVAQAERIIKGQRNAARQADIVEFVPKSRNPDEEETKTIEVLPRFGPYFVSADGGVLYSYIQKDKFPRNRTVNNFNTDTYRSAAMHHVNYETTLYQAKPEDNYLAKWRGGQYFLRTNIDYNLGGIPKLVKFDDAHQALRDRKIDKSNVGPLAVCVGAVENERWVFDDLLKEPPHMLWTGSTGGGKTNMMLSVLLQLCLENRADRLQIYIIDLKKDLSTYIDDLPHIAQIARDVDDGMEVMRKLDAERARRDTLLDRHKRTSWSHWNKDVPSKKKHWPAVVCFLDELHMMMSGNPAAAEFKELNRMIMSLGRRSCVLMVEGTQVASKYVITIDVKANMQTKGSFFLDGNSSQLVLDNWDANKIAPHPGRAIFKQAAYSSEVQTALVASNYTSWFKIDKDEQDERQAAGIRKWANICKEQEGCAPWDLAALAEWGCREEFERDIAELDPPIEWPEVVRVYYLKSEQLREDLAHTHQFSGQIDVLSHLKKSRDREFTWREARWVIKRHKRFWWLVEIAPAAPPDEEEAETERESETAQITVELPELHGDNGNNGNGHKTQTAPYPAELRGNCKYCLHNARCPGEEWDEEDELMRCVNWKWNEEEKELA